MTYLSNTCAWQAKPHCSFDEAVESGLRGLDVEGLTCPMSFRFSLAPRFSPRVYDVRLALKMRQEGLGGASSGHLKEKFAKQVKRDEEAAWELRQKRASQLIGYIMAIEDSDKGDTLIKLCHRNALHKQYHHVRTGAEACRTAQSCESSASVSSSPPVHLKDLVSLEPKPPLEHSRTPVKARKPLSAPSDTQCDTLCRSRTP